MKNIFLIFSIVLLSINVLAQNEVKETYWQAKVDFLEPVINQSVVGRLDYGFKRNLLGLVVGVGGRISEFDNQQYDTYQDKINYRLGAEYQYFLSKEKMNRGFYIGGDLDFSSHTIESKVSDESVKNIAVFTPGLWFGWMWKPIKKADLYIDLTIAHPRYSFGNIEKVTFNTVAKPYVPQNLFNFLGPWSIGWRF